MEDEEWAIIGKLAATAGVFYIAYQLGKAAGKTRITNLELATAYKLLELMDGTLNTVIDTKFPKTTTEPVPKKRHWWQRIWRRPNN